MIYVFLAPGFEEAEALVTVDILRRAGYTVQTAGVGAYEITGSHGIQVRADVRAEDIMPCETLEAVVLPGGMPGTDNLYKSDAVNRFIDYAFNKKLVIGAICAAPSVLGKKGMLKDRVVTCYPGYEKYLEGAEVHAEPCCIADNIVTAKGAGAVFEFGFALADVVGWFSGKTQYGDFSVSQRLEESMQCVR